MEYVHRSSWASKLPANDQVEPTNPNQLETLHMDIVHNFMHVDTIFCLLGEPSMFYGLFYSFTFAKI